MAVPVIASTSKFSDISNETSRTIPNPPGTVSGEWLFLALSADGAPAATTPTGFTLVYDVTVPNSSHRMHLFKRKADGTEGSTFTIETDSESHSGIMCRITGADSTDCIDVLSYGTGELGASPNARCPNAWAECDDSLILRIACSDGGTTTLTDPSGHTAVDSITGLSSGSALSIASEDQATAGYTDSAYFASGAATEEYVGITLVIRSTSTPSAYPAYPVYRSMAFIMPPTNSVVDFEKPYGTESGDTLIMLRVIDSNNFASLTGFTNERSGNVSTTIYARLDYKVAGGSEPDTYPSFTSTAGAYTGILARVVNAHATAPMDSSSVNTGTSSAPTASTITPSVDNCTLGWLVGADDDDVTYDSGYPAGYTGMLAVANQEAADSSFMFAVKAQTTAAATGSVAGVMDASEEWGCIQWALAPAEAATSTFVPRIMEG